MPSYRTGTVTALLSERAGLQRVEVDGERAYVLTQLTGPVSVGNRVVVNTTAVELGLGTGGWHVVHWNLERESWANRGPGTVMKLRYTSLQIDTGSAEEDLPFYPAMSLAGSPVVACGLHSQMAVVAATFKHLRPRRRLVYVMTDSAALPIAISDLVHGLKEAGVLTATVTTGQAFGGDFEAVNIESGLEVADAVAGADAVVAGGGPGVVGTGSGRGFSGLDVVDIASAAARMDGTAIVAVRYSDADARDRHRGPSAHTRHCLSALGSTPVVVPVPRGEAEPALPATIEVDIPDVEAVLAGAGIDVTTMGRGPAEDPGFFRFAAAAGVSAALAVKA